MSSSSKIRLGFAVPEDASHLKGINVSGLSRIAILKSEKYKKNVILLGEIHGQTKSIKCDKKDKESYYKPLQSAPRFLKFVMDEYLKQKEENEQLKPLDIFFETPYEVSEKDDRHFCEMYNICGKNKPSSYYREIGYIHNFVNRLKRWGCFDEERGCIYSDSVRFHTVDTRNSLNPFVRMLDTYMTYFIYSDENKRVQKDIYKALEQTKRYFKNPSEMHRDFDKFISEYKIEKYLKELADRPEIASYFDIEKIHREILPKFIERTSKGELVLSRIVRKYDSINKNLKRAGHYIKNISEDIFDYLHPDYGAVFQALDNLWLWCMDAYAILRTFRKFSETGRVKGEPANIIMYTGGYHTEMYIKMYQSFGFRTLYSEEAYIRENCMDVKEVIQLINFR